MESEPRKFKKGESTGRPIGGNISPEPFPQALYNLARSRGYDSQLSLAEALGKNSNSLMSMWYTGKRIPSPREFDSLVSFLLPNDCLHDRFVEAYGQLLACGKIKTPGSEGALRSGRSLMIPRTTPFDIWLEDYALKSKKTFGAIAAAAKFAAPKLRPSGNVYLSLNTYSEILQRFPDDLGLSVEETVQSSEAVAASIEQAFESGHKFLDERQHPSNIKKAQEQIGYKTYNASQAAKELEISRERVRQYRIKLNLPYLLSDEHLRLIQERRHENSRFAHH